MAMIVGNWRNLTWEHGHDEPFQACFPFTKSLFQYKDRLSAYWVSIIKIRRSWDQLIYIYIYYIYIYIYIPSRTNFLYRQFPTESVLYSYHYFTIVSGNGLVLSGNKPLHGPMMTSVLGVLCCHWVWGSSGRNGFASLSQRWKYVRCNFDTFRKKMRI